MNSINANVFIFNRFIISKGRRDFLLVRLLYQKKLNAMLKEIPATCLIYHQKMLFFASPTGICNENRKICVG